MRSCPGKSRHSRLEAIVLAAGASRRYGPPKQLARFRGETLILRSARLAHEAGAGTVCVVTGYRAILIQRALKADSARQVETTLVTNPRWRDGMGRSLACGIRALQAKTRAVLVCLADQPLLEGEDLTGLVRAWRDSPSAVVASGYAGQIGVPAIFPRSKFGQLRALSGDRGAQDILTSSDGVIAVPMPRAAVDIDYPHDLVKLAN